MKKIIAAAIVMLFCYNGIIVAQNNEREQLLDSITQTIGLQFNRQQMIELSQQFTQENKNIDPVIAEAVAYNITKQLTQSMMAELYNNLTEEQLREVLQFIKSDANRRISSSNVSKELAQFLISDVTTYLTTFVEGMPWKSAVPRLNDNEYATLVDQYLELTGAISIFDKIVNEMKASSSNIQAQGNEFVEKMLKQFQKLFPTYYKRALIKYVTKEQLQEVIDLCSKPFMKEIMQNSQNFTFSFVSEILKDPKSFSDEIMKNFNNIKSINDTVTFVQNYIAFMPSMPISQQINPIYPIKTITLKKFTYTGETFDGLPHGKGTLVDKNGTRYSGSFKEGKRHGSIATYYSGGDSITQMWADDKVMKEQNDDLKKHAPSYKEKPMGYGYDYKNEYIEKGWFIDGKLEGEGERETHNGKTVEKGWFTNGILTKGRILKEIDGKISDFKGSIDGNILIGTLTITNLYDDSEKNIINGTIVNGVMHGKGSAIYEKQGHYQLDKGYFAYDKLYGVGQRVVKEEKNNLTVTYDGEFFAGKLQGRGTLQTSYTNHDAITFKQTIVGYFNSGKTRGNIVYDEHITNITYHEYDNWIFKRFGFDIHHGKHHQTVDKTGKDTLDIHIEGKLLNEELNGYAEITLSNGDYYKGEFKYGNLLNGNARISFANGSVYEGEYKSRSCEGQGKLTYSNGNYDEGTFEDGVCIKGVRKNKQGTIIQKIRR